MKTSKTILIGLMSAVVLTFSTSAVFAQFTPATTPDKYVVAAPIIAVQNVAADASIFKAGDLRVMAWDGDQASWAFDFQDGAVQGVLPLGQSSIYNIGKPLDPDVVVDPSGSGRSIVVYVGENTSQIYCEIFEFSDLGGIQIATPSLVNPSPGFCSSPNVDVSPSGDVVVTWAQDGDIFARRFDFTTGFYSHVLKVNGSDPMSPTGTCSNPDVAISGISSSLANANYMVNIVFNKDYAGKSSTWVQRLSLDEITLGGKGTKNYGYGFTKQIMSGAPGSIGAPRIAAPASGNMSSYDYTVVLRMSFSKTADVIVALTHNLANGGFDNVVYHELNTKPNDISTCTNGDPVVAYVGNSIITAWTYTDTACGMLNGDQDIIVRQLDLNGDWIFPDYSIVDEDINGNQNAPAIAGRFTPGMTFYSYYDEDKLGIAFKSSLFANMSLKKGDEGLNTAETSMGVYPIPMAEETTLSINLAKGETPVSLNVYNVSGQLVNEFDATSLNEGNNLLTWNTKKENIDAGVYLIRLITDKTSKSITVNKAK